MGASQDIRAKKLKVDWESHDHNEFVFQMFASK